MSRYFNPEELAKECGISEKTVTKWLCEYDLPHTRIDDIVLIKETDFDLWMQHKKNKNQERREFFLQNLSHELDKFLGKA